MSAAAHGIRLVDCVHLRASAASISRQISLLSVWLWLRTGILRVLLKLLLLFAVRSSLRTHVGDAFGGAVRGHGRAERLIFDPTSTYPPCIANVDGLSVGHGRAARPAPHRDGRIASGCHCRVVLPHVFARLV